MFLVFNCIPAYHFRKGCGDPRYLDVEELVPGGAAELREMLNSAASAIRQRYPDPNASGANSVGVPPPVHQGTAGRRQQLEQGSIRILPSLSPGGNDTRTMPYQRATLPTATSDPKYLLLCINTKRGLVKPEHVDVSSITNDQFLFQNIERAYRAARRCNDWDLGMLFPRPAQVPGWIPRLLPLSLRINVGLPNWLLPQLEDCRIFIPKTVEFAQVGHMVNASSSFITSLR